MFIQHWGVAQGSYLKAACEQQRERYQIILFPLKNQIHKQTQFVVLILYIS